MVWWLGIDKFNDVVRKITEDLEDVLPVKINGPIILVDDEDLSDGSKEEAKDKE